MQNNGEIAKFRVVVFDFDGTLCDTLPLCVAAFQEAITPFFRRKLTDEEVFSLFGPSESGVLQRLVPEHFAESLELFHAAYRRLHAGYAEPFDGIRGLLAWLQDSGVPLAMATGKGQGSLDISLECLGLTGIFGHMETGSASGPNKPESLRATCDFFGVKPHEALYVGDMESDVRACREVGVPIAAAGWASTSDLASLRAAAPDFLATSVAELRDYLEPRI